MLLIKTSAASDLDLHKWHEWPRPLQIISVFLGMSLFVSVYGIVQHFTGVVPTEAWVDNDAFPELKHVLFPLWSIRIFWADILYWLFH